MTKSNWTRTSKQIKKNKKKHQWFIKIAYRNILTRLFVGNAKCFYKNTKRAESYWSLQTVGVGSRERRKYLQPKELAAMMKVHLDLQ